MINGVLFWGIALSCIICFGCIVIFLPKLIDCIPFIPTSVVDENDLYGRYINKRFIVVWIGCMILFGAFFVYSIIGYSANYYTVTLDRARNDFSACRSEIINIGKNYNISSSKIEYLDNSECYTESMSFQENSCRNEVKLSYDKVKKQKHISISVTNTNSDIHQIENSINKSFISEIFNKFAMSPLNGNAINDFFNSYNSNELIYNEHDNVYEFSDLVDFGLKSNISLIFSADKNKVTFLVSGYMKK